jgi:hypothetical protein
MNLKQGKNMYVCTSHCTAYCIKKMNNDNNNKKDTYLGAPTKRHPTKRHLAQNVTSTKRHQSQNVTCHKMSPVTKHHLT